MARKGAETPQGSQESELERRNREIAEYKTTLDLFDDAEMLFAHLGTSMPGGLSNKMVMQRIKMTEKILRDSLVTLPSVAAGNTQAEGQAKLEMFRKFREAHDPEFSSEQ